MARRRETFDELDARERRYHHARRAWDEAIKTKHTPPAWCVEEMWRTCLGPAQPIIQGTGTHLDVPGQLN